MASKSHPMRRRRTAYRPDVDALEGRQLLTSYKFLTVASFSNLQGSPGGLVSDARGDLFGTTNAGGTSGQGTLFEIAKGAHRPRTLASFSSATGEDPSSSLVMDGRGDIFGVTQTSGANNGGTLYELARGSRTITVLASFGLGQDGESLHPTNLVRDSQGNLYGTATDRSGSPNGAGLIFELPAGSHTISTLYSFQSFFGASPAPRGSGPDNGLAVDAQGDLFGTYFAQGVALVSNPQTFLFELPKGADAITRLATFDEAAAPVTGLTLAKDGTLYGVTDGESATPGPKTVGSVFSYVPGSGASTVTTVASFHGTDGADPTGNPVVDVHGDVFGTTANGGPDYSGPPYGLGSGTVYEVPAGSNTVSSLVGFNGSNGFLPYGLVADSRGDLFGVVQNPTSDTIFELAAVPTRRTRR